MRDHVAVVGLRGKEHLEFVIFNVIQKKFDVLREDFRFNE